jgi:hypothetical protein
MYTNKGLNSFVIGLPLDEGSWLPKGTFRDTRFVLKPHLYFGASPAHGLPFFMHSGERADVVILALLFEILKFIRYFGVVLFVIIVMFGDMLHIVKWQRIEVSILSALEAYGRSLTVPRCVDILHINDWALSAKTMETFAMRITDNLVSLPRFLFAEDSRFVSSTCVCASPR